MAIKALNPWAKYSRATTERHCRTIGMSSGEVGSGKTRFWLTAPGPILVQSMDKGLEGVVEAILEEMPDKEIYFKEYDWNPTGDDFTKEYAEQIRTEILEDFEFGLAKARTILWDKETDIREVFQYAEFGSPTDGNIKDYGRLNQRYFHLINRAKSVPGVNYGLIQSMKDEWKIMQAGVKPDGRPKMSMSKTGQRIRAGWERLDEVVMVELMHTRSAGAYDVTIGKCRQNGDLQDTENPGGFTFPEFGTLLMPGTTEEDWS